MESGQRGMGGMPSGAELPLSFLDGAIDKRLLLFPQRILPHRLFSDDKGDGGGEEVIKIHVFRCC